VVVEREASPELLQMVVVKVKPAWVMAVLKR
jgi:hypothetical protein